jgi:hypothetical protein
MNHSEANEPLRRRSDRENEFHFSADQGSESQDIHPGERVPASRARASLKSERRADALKAFPPPLTTKKRHESELKMP